MSSWYATSGDGLTWSFNGAALTPTVRTWDARGTRITSVLSEGDTWTAWYDGRNSAAANTQERTGVAVGHASSAFTALAGPNPGGGTARYLSIVRLPDGDRLYWEAARADGAHELRTEYVPRP